MQAQTTLLVVLAAFLALLPVPIESHIWLQCPPPRQCFYGIPPTSLNPDGRWRNAACDSSPGSPKSTFYAGQSICLRWYEFVAHSGYYEIWLSASSVGVGDPQSSFTHLVAKIQDNDSSQTGYWGATVTLPSNLTCESCTLQILQWVNDFKWYYYSCADVTILPASSASNRTFTDCVSRISSNTCVWEAAPPRIREMILQSILIGIGFAVFGVWLLRVLVGSCLHYRRMRSSARNTITIPDAGDVSKSDVAPSAVSALRTVLVRNKWWVIVGGSIIIAYFISVLITLLVLKTCSYGNDISQ
eukprot:GILI01019283.1.p1 GENE.GILI01019283.1~~GILI01019283.1.p1  ORF type:complete len:310 (+),score=26.84 GILI01019283.1:29-931(+)